MTSATSRTPAAAAKSRANTRRHGRPRNHLHGLPAAAESFVGYVHMDKAGGAFIYRSAIERDALAVLALDHGVAQIDRADYTDSERIELDVARRPPATVFELPDLGRYTPDLRVVLDSGEVTYVEVGYHADKVGSAEMFRRLQAAAVEAARTGAGFLILTERVLR